MHTNDSQLQQLLYQCSSPIPNDRAWNRFWKKYHTRIKQFTIYALHKNISKRHPLFKDIVNDIVSDALITIKENLASYKHTESEDRFLAWMSIIINRITIRYIQKNYNRIFFDNQIQEKSRYIQPNRWELYEYIVFSFRKLAAKNSIHTERDISLFTLNAFSEFTPADLLRMPCYKNLTERTIRLALDRLRKKLEKVDFF